MKRFGKIAAWMIEGLTHLTGWIAAASLVAAAIIVTEGVVVRKVFGISTIWQIEASVYLLIFTVFSGAAFVQRSEHHLNVDLVIIHLSPKTREITLIVVSIISCIVAVILGWYAWPMWWETLINHQHSESLWGPPLWIPYLFLPLGMTLLFLQYILHIRNKIRALRTGEYKEEMALFELRDIDLPKADSDSQ